MGSLSSRLRPTMHATSREPNDARMLQLDQTVVMEVRGRHIELQTKKTDCSKNKRRQHNRNDVSADRVELQCEEAAVETTGNHISSTGPDDRPDKDSGKNNQDGAEYVQSSAEDRETCTAATINTPTVTANRQLLQCFV